MNMTVTESIQRIRGLSLIGSPLFFLISELLHPVTQDEAVKELQSVASNHTQWYLAHMAALFAIILLPYAIQGLLVLIEELEDAPQPLKERA
nr:hypothetical protein [Bacillota bacterium]